MSLRQICPRRLMSSSRLALPSIMLVSGADNAAGAEITGTGVDRYARSVPRAFVRIMVEDAPGL